MMSYLKLYGVLGTLYMISCYVRTRLFYRESRFIRFPFDIRGRKYINLGRNLTLGKNCRFEVFPHLMIEGENIKLRIGENVQMNDNVHICAMQSVKIGDNVLMASHVFISDNSHGCYKGVDNDSDPSIPPVERDYSTAPVRIGNNVWIGEGVAIMPGVEIGDGCVIGAHSIVNQSIPPHTIAVGAPAIPVKRWDSEKRKWIKI